MCVSTNHCTEMYAMLLNYILTDVWTLMLISNNEVSDSGDA